MAKSKKTDERLYTYRNGKKSIPEKASNQFVVRSKPEELEITGVVTDIEKISPAFVKS